MKQDQIRIGSVYAVKVSGLIAPVRVDRIKATVVLGAARAQGKARYEGTNLKTGRTVAFTAAKCRYELQSAEVAEALAGRAL